MQAPTQPFSGAFGALLLGLQKERKMRVAEAALRAELVPSRSYFPRMALAGGGEHVGAYYPHASGERLAKRACGGFGRAV